MRDRDAYTDTDEIPPWVWRAVKIGGVVLLAIILFFLFTTRISAGKACTVTHFGKPVDEAGPGIHFRIPVRDRYNCLSSRKQTYEIVAGDPKQSDSKANYVDWAIQGKTNEGIDFYIMATTQYHVPVENARLVWEGNARSDERVKEQIVKFHTRAILPQVLNTYSAEQLYLGDLRGISDQIGADLRTRFEANGVVLDYFELKRGDFDDSYEQAIRDKALKVEEAKRKALEQQVATAEAERLRIEAEGQKAAAIIAAEASAEEQRIRAQGDADSTELRGKALEQNPSVLEWERIQVLRSANVVYLPSDTIIPILPLNPEPTATSTP